MINELYTLIPPFLSYKKARKYKNKTIKNYDTDLLQFLKWILWKKGSKTKFDDITIVDIEGYIQHLASLPCPKRSIYSGVHSGLSMTTIGLKINNIKQFFRYYNIYHDQGMKYEKIEIPKYKKPEPEFLTREEVEELLKCPKILDKRQDVIVRNTLFIYMAYTTGMRLSELLSIKIYQLPKKGSEMIIKGKGDKKRTVYINKACKNLITEYLFYRYGDRIIKFNQKRYYLNHNTEYLFVSMTDGHFGKKMTKQMIAEIFQKYRAYLSIQKRITCHILRHSFATTMLNKETNIRTLQDMMGHAYVTTTQGYTHIVNKQKEEAHVNVFGE